MRYHCSVGGGGGTQLVQPRGVEREVRGGGQLGWVLGGIAGEPGARGGGGVPGVPRHRQLVAALHRLGEEGPDGGAADGVLGDRGFVLLQEGGGGGGTGS